MSARDFPLHCDRADLELCVSLRLERVPEDVWGVGEDNRPKLIPTFHTEPSLSFDLVGRPRTKEDLAAAVRLLRKLADDVEAQLAGELAGVTAS